ncbi:MAG: hypothetical protein KBS76_05370 [Ruminococcus sp.]|nr:hypothetical protein [Candidatus Apopatosoma intestinale]
MNRFFYDEIWQIFSFLILGFATGSFFDVFRLIRLAFSDDSTVTENAFYRKIAPPHYFDRHEKTKHGKVLETLLVGIEDVLFFLISSILFSFQTYWVNDGEIRIWGILLLLLGFFLWRMTLGKIVLFFSAQILFFAKILIYWSFYIIIKPIRVAFSFIITVFLTVYRKTVSALRAKWILSRRKRYTARECNRILSESRKGFS